jgi:hypothetical protein
MGNRAIDPHHYIWNCELQFGQTLHAAIVFCRVSKRQAVSNSYEI